MPEKAHYLAQTIERIDITGIDSLRRRSMRHIMVVLGLLATNVFFAFIAMPGNAPRESRRAGRMRCDGSP